MHPVLFRIGAWSFYTHGVMSVLGIIIGSLVVYFLARKKALDVGYFFDNIVFTVLFGIIGARIAYLILYHDQFSGFASTINLQKGGLVSYGGFILGGVVFAFLLRSQKQPILRWLDVTSIGFFLGLSLGRIGCLLAGEYDGITTSNKWLSVLPQNNTIATSFFEAILCLIIFGAGVVAYNKLYDKINTGIIFFSSIIVYALGRFIIDFGGSEGDLFWKISIGQLFSAIIITISLIALIRMQKRSPNDRRQEVL